MSIYHAMVDVVEGIKKARKENNIRSIDCILFKVLKDSERVFSSDEYSRENREGKLTCYDARKLKDLASKLGGYLNVLNYSNGQEEIEKECIDQIQQILYSLHYVIDEKTQKGDK